MALNQLAYYAQRVAETHGLPHVMMLNNLRDYIKQTPDEELVKEIKETHKHEQLRAMWEAGLNSTLQQAVLARLEELEARRV